MSLNVDLATEAVQDLSETYAWYESRRIGLGEDFLTCIDACLQSIGRSPEMFEGIYKTYRRAIVRRFPYAIYFKLEAEGIIVYCVYHAARDPDKWRQRLP